MFSVLPFGLSSAPYIFTKLLKPLVKKRRAAEKSIILFLDDGLDAAQPFSLVKICSLQIHADLLKFGLLPNDEKYIHTYIQTLLKLPKWVFQFNTTKTYKLKFKLVKNVFGNPVRALFG